MKRYVIIAPHGDDELIGCYELFERGLVKSVLYQDPRDKEEAIHLADAFDIDVFLFEDFNFTHKGSYGEIYLFPDPTYEIHPQHRILGHLGEELLRGGREVIFYSTNMLTPYIHEVQIPEKKKQLLDTFYPRKANLWEFDHKYYLFEGYTKWITRWPD